jgi:adenylate cyclase
LTALPKTSSRRCRATALSSSSPVTHHFTCKDKPVDLKQIAREPGVRYVLEGSIRRSDICVRVTGQLIEAESGWHLWADRFDVDLYNIFDL